MVRAWLIKEGLDLDAAINGPDYHWSVLMSNANMFTKEHSFEIYWASQHLPTEVEIDKCLAWAKEQMLKRLNRA